MSSLYPKVWRIPCARCLTAVVTIREEWDPYADIFCGFLSHPPGSVGRYLGGREKDNEQFLVLCPGCNSIVRSKNLTIFPVFCCSCLRPILMLINPQTGVIELFGGKADITMLDSKLLVGGQQCNTCLIFEDAGIS